MATEILDLVGLKDIADMLGVRQDTPRKWRTRGVLPEPDGTISGRPVWKRQTIMAWHDKRKEHADETASDAVAATA